MSVFDCECGVDCIPEFDEDIDNWLFCSDDFPCDGPWPCPSCEEWAAENNVPIDYDNEYWLNRTADFPSDTESQCEDACQCQKDDCVQNCSPRLGLENNNKTCFSCTECPPCNGRREYVEFPVSYWGEHQCDGYWDALAGLDPPVYPAYPGEEADVNLTALCEVINSECVCIIDNCVCLPCVDCVVCPENQYGFECDVEPPKFYYDTEMYYYDHPDVGACERSCTSCPSCEGNETHVIHRDFVRCDEGTCLNYDGSTNECANQIQTCEDPCNCDIETPCIPTFSESNAQDYRVFCDGRYEQFNTTLSGDLPLVQCDSCVPCACNESVCGPNEYVDVDYVCGRTTSLESCGLPQLEEGLPCSCAEDQCDMCADCSPVRYFWFNGANASSICYEGTMLEWDSSKLLSAGECLESNCTNPAKVDEICQCNCFNCTEPLYLRSICDAAGASGPPVCQGADQDLTCNEYFQYSYDSTLFYEFDPDSCSCAICGFTNYSHLGCDPYEPGFAISEDGCSCVTCEDSDSLCCPEEFDPDTCDPELGLRPSSDYCECESCPEQECNICEIPGTVCEFSDGDNPYDRVLECIEKPECVDSQPALVSCEGNVGIIPQCVNETDIVRSYHCYEYCENCTGILCDVDLDTGQPIYNMRPNEDDPCLCEECPVDYECEVDWTPVTLEGVALPSILNESQIFLLSSNDALGFASYWEHRCNETCIPCTETLCAEIGALLAFPLQTDEDNPCNCLSCPYEFECPSCPWCDPTDTESNCTCEYVEDVDGGLTVTCLPPTECVGNNPGDCDFTPIHGSTGANGTCYWDGDDLPFLSGFVSSGCTCEYYHSPDFCPTPVNDCESEYDICDPAFKCFCECIPQCYNSYCSPRTCQPNFCTPGVCEPCPDCPEGYYRLFGDVSDSEWLCNGTQCDCEPCLEVCEANEYFDEENCICHPCLIDCHQTPDNETDFRPLEVYVYPSGNETECTCQVCEETELGCGLECEDCGRLVVENNVCKCKWCLPDEFSNVVYDSYSEEDCPLYADDDGEGEGEGEDTGAFNITCLCGLKGSRPSDPRSEEDGGCPFAYVCGCCPTDYLECIEAGNPVSFCETKICEVQLDCNGECTGIPLFVDSCGILCGSNECIESDENTTSPPICLYADLCGICGGNGESCAGCDGVPNSGLEWGINCSDGELLCDGVDEDTCPVPLAVVVAASVAAGVAGAVSLVALAALASLVAAGIIRRGHYRDQVLASYEECLEQELNMICDNPLSQGNALNFEVNLQDVVDL